jgi:hypothetical protein
MEISPVDERDFDRRALQVLRGGHPAEPTAKNDDSMFVPHPFSPERNLTHPDIISFTVVFTRLMRGIRWRILNLRLTWRLHAIPRSGLMWKR